MKIVDKRLREAADVINKKFAKVNEENRGEVSGEILSHLRNFCEAFMYKVYDEENDADIYQTQDNLTPVRKYIKDTRTLRPQKTYMSIWFSWRKN